MFRVLPLHGCWQLKADSLPASEAGAALRAPLGRTFSLPGADALTHVAVDTGFRVEDDAAAVVGGRLAGLEGVHGAARLTEKLGDGFSHKREIHYICPLFCLSISVAFTSPSMMASGLGVQPATETSTWR